MLNYKLIDQCHFHFSDDKSKCLVLDKISFSIFKIPHNIGAIIHYLKVVRDVDLVCSRFNISSDQCMQVLTRFLNKISQTQIQTQTYPHNELPQNLKILRLVITNTCNLKCKYCYADEGTYHSNKKYMTTDEARIIIDKVLEAYNGIEEICFFGGEPLLNVDVIEVVCEYLSQKFRDGLIPMMPRFSTVSNGTIMNQKIITLIDKFKIYTTISIDGPQEIHDELRIDKAGLGSFQRIKSNIERLSKSTPQPSMIECTYTSLHEQNQYTDKNLLTYFNQNFGVKTVVINPVGVSGKNDDSKDLTPNRTKFQKNMSSISEQFNEFLEQGIQHTGVLRFITALQNKDGAQSLQYHCNAGIEQLTVNTTGEVYPCQLFIGLDDNRFSMGNMLYDEIFNEQFKHIQSLLINNNKQNYSTCKDCPERRLCSSCIAIVYENDNKLVPSSKEYCNKRKQTNEQYIDCALDIYADAHKFDLLMKRIEDVKEHFKLREVQL